ncbi:hypothetical protein Tco_0707403 [Tanacetum coccineum]|uniref:Uncharacterized protein n=1 Tax=Tanacetum coccineum TaxID=301880 RepID=A0ABQ4YCB3_9ASTR
MVAYLQKPEGSEAFHQIVDFLNTSHIKYALIENPKIYISLIQQFWGTATARTTDDGEVEITASIDGQVKTITEASLRRHLKLEDSDGITSLPNTEIFEQLALIGYVSDSARLTFQKGYFSPQWRFFIHTILHLVDEATFTSVDVHAGGAATTDIGLDVVTKLTDKVEVLENGMQQTKKVYSSALTKLILRVKKLEKKGRKIFEIDKDPTISLVQHEQGMEYDFDVCIVEGFTTASVPVTTAGIEISTANISVSTASATPEVSTTARNLVYIRRSAKKRKDKGKAIMKEDKSVQKKTKKQLEQERLGHEEVIRLQEQFNEEEKQRIVRDAEIELNIQNRSFFKAEVRKNMCIYLKNQGGYKQSHFKGMKYEDIRPIFERVWDKNHSFVPKDYEIEKEVMKRPGFDFHKKFSKKRSREDSDEENAKKQKLEDDAGKKELRDKESTDYTNLIRADNIDSCGIHMLLMHIGIAIHMMIEKKYPLTQEMLSRMLSRRLEVDQESEMAFELLRFIRSQLQK